MKKLMLALVAFSLLGCGGGGGGTAAAPPTTSPTVAVSTVATSATSATYKLSLAGSVAAGAVKGVQFSLKLPDSVTIKTTIDPGTSGVVPDPSSFYWSGTAFSGGTMLAGFSSGSLNIGAISTTGFSAGEFATLVCDVKTGMTAPSSSEFTVNSLTITN